MKIQHHLAQALSGALLLFSLCATSLGAGLPVESPVGEFGFDAPAEPPSGPPLITPMVYLNGAYTNSFYNLPGSTALTMDVSGKVEALTQVTGFAPKGGTTGAPLIFRTLFVRTVNGLPVLTGNAKAGGMYDDGFDDAPTEGTGKASVPLGGPMGQVVGNVLPVTVMSSFSGKRGGQPDKDPVQMDTLELDVNQLSGVVFKAWGMNLLIEEKTDSKGKKFYVADLQLNKQDNTYVQFPPKTVVYSPTKGYSVAFSKGALFQQGTNAPIVNSKGPVKDPAAVKFDGLLFKKTFNGNTVVWTPAAGGVSYKFFGQSGFGQVFHFNITVF